MKELIPKDKFGVFVDNKDVARVDSLFVAKFFEKRHDDVLKSIRNLDCSEEFNHRNFAEITYTDTKGRKQKAVAMTRDGFTFLAMGYRGKKAAHFKELYIKRFNEMESFIRTLVTTRKEFPLLTENIKLLHENPKPYHFSNECDMINKLVTGMTAKKFRETHGVPKGESIRPYLTDEQLELMEKLQKCDVGLLVAFPDYEQRKRHLEWYMSQIKKNSNQSDNKEVRRKFSSKSVPKGANQTDNKETLEKYCSTCDSITKTIINYDDCSATCSICKERTIVPALQYRKLKQSI